MVNFIINCMHILMVISLLLKIEALLPCFCRKAYMGVLFCIFMTTGFVSGKKMEQKCIYNNRQHTLVCVVLKYLFKTQTICMLKLYRVFMFGLCQTCPNNCQSFGLCNIWARILFINLISSRRRSRIEIVAESADYFFFRMFFAKIQSQKLAFSAI